jgi:twitching motility protein PilT
MIEEALTKGIQVEASDVHIRSDRRPLFRVDGVLREWDGDILTHEEMGAWLRSMIPPREWERLQDGGEIDFSFEHRRGVRFRANAYRHAHGLGCALRHIPSETPSLEQLGLPPVAQQISRYSKGLVLITGVTGSGKSTTAASLIEQINIEQAVHIITIEDPIEFVFVPQRALISQRAIGHHTASPASALRAALREDPDVLFVGEMRDAETIQLALTAAETGHLVISTLHTRSAATTVDRIVDVFPAAQQQHVRTMIADSLAAVISQELLPSPSGGRSLVAEVLFGTPAVAALIREGKTHQLEHVMQTSQSLGMRTRESHLQSLIEQGRVLMSSENDRW